MEFSKILLLIDYLLMVVIFILAIVFPDVDFTTIACAWVAQIGISSGAYYWKTKSDNRTKVPFKVIENLPEDMRKEIDLTQIITSIITSE